jgi:GNAT superfamily N-acetyltransferase
LATTNTSPAIAPITEPTGKLPGPGWERPPRVIGASRVTAPGLPAHLRTAPSREIGRRAKLALPVYSRHAYPMGVEHTEGGRPADSPGGIDVALLPAASDQRAAVERVAALVNDVYAAAEDGLWVDGTARTSVEEIAGLARAGRIAVARLAGRIVGCVRIGRHDEDTGEFGMLAADPAHRGTGIGRELVRFAECACGAEGLHGMRLEVLVPRDRPHPGKQFLLAWYARMGYRLDRTGSVAEAYPELVRLLAVPADLAIYHKVLAR